MLRVFLKCTNRVILFAFAFVYLSGCVKKDNEGDLAQIKLDELKSSESMIESIDQSEEAIEFLQNHCLNIYEMSNRIFKASYPVEVEGDTCYKIDFLGELNNGSTYLLDSFAVYLTKNRNRNFENCKVYYYDRKTDQYEKFDIKPFYSNYISPDGLYTIETAEMGNGHMDPYHYMYKLRVMDLTTGDYIWVLDEFFLPGNELWSPDSRFIVVEVHTNYLFDCIIIDTSDFSIDTIQGDNAYELLNIERRKRKMVEDFKERFYYAREWTENSVLLIDFYDEEPPYDPISFYYDVERKTANLLPTSK